MLWVGTATPSLGPLGPTTALRNLTPGLRGLCPRRWPRTQEGLAGAEVRPCFCPPLTRCTTSFLAGFI